MSLGRQSSIINNLLSAGSCKRRTSASIAKMRQMQSGYKNEYKEGGILDMSI